MTMYRRQLIPLPTWVYRTNTGAERDAIVRPLWGALCNVINQGLFQYHGTWTAVPGFGSTLPGRNIFSYSDEHFTGASVTLSAATFPDPGVITEDEGNKIFDIYVGGQRQWYKTTATEIGEFQIDDVTKEVIFPVSIDDQHLQIKIHPTDTVFSYSDENFSGSSVVLVGYTFPDPGLITEDEGNLIFDVWVGGMKLYYKTTPTAIGHFGIDNITGEMLFPVSIDDQPLHIKALIV